MSSFLSNVFGVLAARLGLTGGEREDDEDAARKPAAADRPAQPGASGILQFKSKLTGDEDDEDWLAEGHIVAQFDPATKILTWTVEYSELGVPTRACFVDPTKWSEEKPDPDQLPLSGSLASPIKGSAVLTEPQIAQLTAENWMFTLESPEGEIYDVLKRAR